MNFQINTKKATEAKADCLILPIFKDKKLRGATKTINTANNKVCLLYTSDAADE